MAERRPSLKDRLSRLEAELDELIRLQESNKIKPSENVNVPWKEHHGQYCQFQQCRAVNVTTRSKTMISNHHSCCIRDPGASAPLTDISRFLQNINFNISKGTQAITKMATSASQETAERGQTKKSCNNCITIRGHQNDVSNAWKSSGEKKINEDSVYKELREEKDKRMRAENQVKSLKDELKKTKSEIQQKSESTIYALREELKETLEKLKQAEYEIHKINEDYKSTVYLWPLKYETVNKELQEERHKRREADENIHQLQDTLQKLFIDTEEHLTLQKTLNWIKNQNENLLCLTKRLRGEIETKNWEIGKKNRCIEDYVGRIKQLTGLCRKLRDFLVVARDKAETSERKLKLAMEHSQRLSERMLQAQRQVEELQTCREEGKNEHKRLSELLRCSEIKINSLHSKLEEMSDVMKKQNELITRQSNTIDNKDEQLKLAYENIKLQSQRLVDLENTLSGFQNGSDAKQKGHLQSELSRLLIDLENEKENVKINEKVIDSNLKTISEKKNELLRKESEINELRRGLSETERKLSIEKTTNEELLSKIKQLQLRKEELKRRVENLEEESFQLSENTSKIEQIEKQIQVKQKEWEALKAKLTKEKEEALEALRCFSQKLAEKTAGYEMELETTQEVINSLNSQIQQKDTKIQESKCEILRLTKQVQEAEERGENMKKHLEDSLKAACESWHKTMQQVII